MEKKQHEKPVVTKKGEPDNPDKSILDMDQEVKQHYPHPDKKDKQYNTQEEFIDDTTNVEQGTGHSGGE
jgi:hypothetical protein